jgi:DNA-binding beta-propeller fold protein YncE
MGVAIGKGGAAVFAEFDTGRLMWTQSGDASELAVGLDRPTGVAVDSNGTVFVAESGSGRVGAIRRGRIESVVAGLIEPHGIAIHNERLFILDVGSKQLIESDISGTGPRVIAAGLPVGAPPATATKPLGGFGNMSGPLLPFSGLAAGQDGSLYIAADTEGSVMCLRPQKDLSAPAAYRA